MSVKKIGVGIQHLKRKLSDKLYKSQGGYMLDVMLGGVIAALIIVIILVTYNTVSNSTKASQANSAIATMKASATSIYASGGLPSAATDLIATDTGPWKDSKYLFAAETATNTYTLSVTKVPDGNCNAMAAYWKPFSIEPAGSTSSTCTAGTVAVVFNP